TAGDEIFMDASVDTQRPTFTRYTADLTGSQYQNLSSPVTFRVYQFTGNDGASVEYDDIQVNAVIRLGLVSSWEFGTADPTVVAGGFTSSPVTAGAGLSNFNPNFDGGYATQPAL